MKKCLPDLTMSIIALILGAIPMLYIALMLKLFYGSPVLFYQTRIGQKMRPFRMYKFRTMIDIPNNTNSLTIGKDPRISKLGCWLRKYHLDELPQLFNILIGDMSFIGPRPEIPEFVDPNDPIQQQVLLSRPGLLDNAVLHWLNESQILSQTADWEGYYRRVILPDKLKQSLYDIKTRSLKNDIKLLKEALYLIF